MSDQTKDPIKEAFIKAKQDIFSLAAQIESLKREIQSLKELIKLSSNASSDRQTDTSAQNHKNQAFQHINPAQNPLPVDNSAQKQPYNDLKSPISNISIGNEGVPADRQTDQQTVNKQEIVELNELLIQHIHHHTTQQHSQKPLEKVSQVLASLDSIKKDLRVQFKRLTNQEMAVFSTIYQLEEEGFIVDYLLISQKLNLTESSIRDYIQRILKKGIPLIKTKENNKKILLSITSDLKKLATLSTIIQLREL